MTYLTQRFDHERTSIRIAEQRKLNRAVISETDLVYYQEIVELEKNLDAAFEADELMCYYFSPIETRERYHDHVLTLGSLLLPFSCDPSKINGFDDLIAQFSSETDAQRFSHFCSVLLPFAGEVKKSDYSFPDFLKTVDDILVQKEDKWNLIDVISHPIEHLQKLKPLCCAITDYIGSRLEVFSPFISQCRDEFCVPGLFAENLRILNFNLSDADVDRVVIYPSLFNFSSFSFAAETDGDIVINMGVFANRIIDARRRQNNPDTYLILLKLLSDGTRLRALYELCDKYSYGQELAEKLGSAKNAMYYHLEKLFSVGLIDLKVTDYRMLYTMNKKQVYDQLTALRDFLVNGWKPEDDQYRN